MAEKKKGLISSKKKYNGDTEYYMTKSPAKTKVGKILIIVLAAGMGLTVLVSLVILLIELMK